jgi:N-acetylmuramoyl-L-alanine amidase
MQWLVNLWRKLFNIKPNVVMVDAPPTVFPEPEGDIELPQMGESGIVKLGIVVGHTRKAKGARMAAPYNFSEYDWNSDLAKMMQDYAKKMYSDVKTHIIFRDLGGISGAYAEARAERCDCVIELHFNGFNGQAAGTSTLTTPAADDQEFAHIIQKAMVALYGRVGKFDRGVKSLSKADRGGGNVHSFPGGANCLIEPFFGDNPAEAKMGIEKKAALAKCLVDAVVLWAKKKDLIRAQ